MVSAVLRTLSTLLLFLAVGASLVATEPQAPVVKLRESAVELSWSADGTKPFSYQWYRNGVAIEGETAEVLRITDPKATGVYHVVISNSAGSLKSGTVRLSNTSQADAADFTLTRKHPK